MTQILNSTMDAALGRIVNQVDGILLDYLEDSKQAKLFLPCDNPVVRQQIITLIAGGLWYEIEALSPEFYRVHITTLKRRGQGTLGASSQTHNITLGFYPDAEGDEPIKLGLPEGFRWIEQLIENTFGQQLEEIGNDPESESSINAAIDVFRLVILAIAKPELLSFALGSNHAETIAQEVQSLLEHLANGDHLVKTLMVEHAVWRADGKCAERDAS